MRSTEDSSRLEVLADTLWAERRVVEYLLYRLITAKLLLEASERRFVTLALDEVESMLGMLRSAELRRAAALEPVAQAWGYDPEALTLTELAQQAPPPMDAVFRDHHQAFMRLASEIEDTAATNRKLATSSLADVRQALDALAGPPVASTYTAAGRHDTAPVRPVRLDEVL
jgi:hypothetical protein